MGYLTKKVRFAKSVSIRKYPIAIGDSPCSSGPPISFGWKPDSVESCNLELLEYMKEQRRNERPVVISIEERTDILLDAGFSNSEILRATLKACDVRQKREATIKNLGRDRICRLLGGVKFLMGTRKPNTMFAAGA